MKKHTTLFQNKKIKIKYKKYQLKQQWGLNKDEKFDLHKVLNAAYNDVL